jgi:hypothetical protein
LADLGLWILDYKKKTKGPMFTLMLGLHEICMKVAGSSAVTCDGPMQGLGIVFRVKTGEQVQHMAAANASCTQQYPSR